MKKIKVAVTGNIGSGKSTFCKFLEEMNYVVIKADEIAKDLLANDDEIKKRIIKHFGKDAFTKNGINKNYLASKIFDNQNNLDKINSIVHPTVIKKVELQMNRQLLKSNIVFHEAALIYEAGIEELFDYVVLISADFNVRKTRTLRQQKFSDEDFNRRELNQILDEEKKKQADFVFLNDGSFEDLRTKAKMLVKILEAMVHG